MIDIINPITNSKIFNNHLKKVINDDAFAAKSIVVCSVLKDVFAYSVRYKTTMENPKIPEKRRPFVAAMDMASGVVTSIAQIVVGFAIASPKIQNKLWNALFKNTQFKNIGMAKKSFTTILALIGSGVITERILVPLIATPLAAKIEKKFFHNPSNISHLDKTTEGTKKSWIFKPSIANFGLKKKQNEIL